jgi:hypothetical protein
MPVLTLDHAKINSWADADTVSAFEDADAKLTSIGYTHEPRWGLGWSMGVPTLMSFGIRNPSKMGAIWGFNGATDQQYFNDTAYTPPYSYAGLTNKGAFGPVAQGGTDEIPQTFQPTSAATGAVTIPAVGGAGVTVPITAGTGKSFADGNTFGGVVALPRATVNGVAFTYTGKTDNSLTGCVSTTAGTITVANGNAITTAWATQMPAYVPFNLAAYYGTLGIKTRLVQASDDTTVPPAMNANDANGFVGRANSANVTLRSPSPTGGHSFGIDTAQIPTSEFVNWLVANAA